LTVNGIALSSLWYWLGCFLFNYSISGWALNLHYNQVKTLGTGLPERCNSFFHSFCPMGYYFLLVSSGITGDLLTHATGLC